jgi:hypothetical protein
MRILSIISVLLIFIPILYGEEKKTPSQLDACSLLSPTRVEEFLGEKAKQPTPVGAEEPQPTATSAAISACTWESVAQSAGLPSKSIYLWVRRAPAAVNDSEQVMEQFRKDPKTGAARDLQALPGFGEAALWMTGRIGKQKRLEMNVMKKDLVAQVVLTGYEDAIAAQNTARAIVEKVWEKLGMK